MNASAWLFRDVDGDAWVYADGFYRIATTAPPRPNWFCFTPKELRALEDGLIVRLRTNEWRWRDDRLREGAASTNAWSFPRSQFADLRALQPWPQLPPPPHPQLRWHAGLLYDTENHRSMWLDDLLFLLAYNAWGVRSFTDDGRLMVFGKCSSITRADLEECARPFRVPPAEAL